MITGLLEKRLLNKELNGKEFLGEWVAHSVFAYNVVPNIKDKSICLFQIWARVDVDYENGSSKEFTFEVVYQFFKLTDLPQIADLIFFADDSFEKVSEMFNNEMQASGANIIKQNESDKKRLIEKSLNEAYPQGF